MAKLNEVIAGHSVEIDDNDNLTIAGKPIDYAHDPQSNKWSSRYLPYSQFDSLDGLARAIARDTVEFVGSEN